MGTKSKQQTTTQTTEPWKPAIPYLTTGLAQAEGVLNNPTEYYQGQQVAPFSATTQQAIDLIRKRATGGDPTVAAGQQMLTDTLQGEYLAGNPYRDQMLQSAMRPVMEQYASSVAPRLASSANRAGMYGSDVYADRAAQTERAFADSLTDMAGSLTYQDYANERANQFGAANQALAYADQQYQDLSALSQAGALQDQRSQDVINAEIARWQYEQDEPYTRLARYMGLVAPTAGLGGTSTQVTPIYRNQGAGIAGGAMAGAQMGSMFGPWGMAGGALLGGIGGAF